MATRPRGLREHQKQVPMNFRMRAAYKPCGPSGVLVKASQFSPGIHLYLSSGESERPGSPPYSGFLASRSISVSADQAFNRQ